MFAIICPETAKLADALTACQRHATVAAAAALLTVPRLQANALRLEILAHVAAAKCRGQKIPTDRELEKWLNVDLGRSQIALAEDPPASASCLAASSAV